MKIYALGDSHHFVIERNGNYTFDDWPCDTVKTLAMIADGELVEITPAEAQKRLDGLSSGAAYWPLPNAKA